MSVCLCYISLGPRDDPQEIARTLVEERPAAAINVQTGVQSFYRWQGRVEEAPEVTLIAKTRAALVPRLAARVVELHSYECPAVVAVPIEAGHPAYLTWIEENC
jgi:periplasmic divalent cation tolerance protein